MEGGIASLKSWSQIHVSRDDSSIHETEHAITQVVLSDRWRLSERIVSEVLWQDPLGEENFVWASGADSQFFKFNIADATLRSTIFELVGLRQLILAPQEVMTSQVLWVPGEVREFLFVHEYLYRLANNFELLCNGRFFYNNFYLKYEK